MNFNQNSFNHCLLASSARGFQCLLTCIVVSSVYLLASWFSVFTWIASSWFPVFTIRSLFLLVCRTSGLQIIRLQVNLR